MRVALFTLALLLAPPLLAPALHAQAPSARVAVAGVDTTIADVGAIVRLVRDYLARPDSSARARGLWSEADPLDRRFGDVAGFYAYHGVPATVAGVRPTGDGDSLYVVQILHAHADSAGEVEPLALQRLYAVRASGAPHGWRLSGALPRHTRDWPTRTVGRITFHYAPGQRSDSVRARRAVRFVDSVATIFGVTPPERIDYYVTASPDEYFRSMGLDFAHLPSGPRGAKGGNALPALVFAGDPAQGEAYLHELAHVLLARGYRGVVLGEGVAVWLTGSQGRSPADAYRLLAEWQRAHPKATIESLVRGDEGWGPEEFDMMQFTGALFLDHVHRRSGAAGLRALAGIRPAADSVLAAMRTHLGLSSDPAALDAWWRRAAAEAAARPAP